MADLLLFSHLTALSSYAKDAEPVIRDMLRRRPFDYLALRALGAYLISQNDLKGSCEALRVYDVIFEKNVSKNRFLSNYGAAIPTPVEFKSDQQFKNDYLTWIKLYQ